MVMTLCRQASASRRLPGLAAAGSGLLTPLVFAPFNGWPLAFVLPVLFWQLTTGVAPGRAFRRGWLFGAGFFLSGVSWVYGSMRTVDSPILLAAVLTLAFGIALGLLFALQAWLPAWWQTRSGQGPDRRARRLLVLLPALWVLFEFLRSTLFTGLPWLLWGTIGSSSWLRGWLPLIGVYGLSLLVLVVATGLFAGLNGRRPAWWFSAAGLGLVLAGSAAFDRLNYTRPQGDSAVTAAVIQGNIPQRNKWQPAQLAPTLSAYRRATQGFPEADLILWPETAITAYPYQVAEFLDDLENTLQQRQQALIAGAPLSQGQGQGQGQAYYNGLIGLGQAGGQYRKQHLVPFGEYIPIQALIKPLMQVFNLPLSGFSAGLANQPPMTLRHAGDDFALGTLICYEAAYPALARQQARTAGILVVTSNDAWFGKSLAPAQHLQITRVRAIENRRPLVRATQTGISVITDQRGRILAQVGHGRAGGASADIRPVSGLTPYQKWGDRPVLILALTAALLAAGQPLRHRRRQLS